MNPVLAIGPKHTRHVTGALVHAVDREYVYCSRYKHLHMITRLGRQEGLHAGQELKSSAAHLHLLLHPSMQLARCCIASLHTLTRTFAHTACYHHFIIASHVPGQRTAQQQQQRSKMAPKRGAYMLHTCFIHESSPVYRQLLAFYFGQRSRSSPCLPVASQRRQIRRSTLTRINQSLTLARWQFRDTSANIMGFILRLLLHTAKISSSLPPKDPR
ncbi:hypothetical protein V8C26DRAFT_245179 [Trichoderma gracile]